MSPQTLLLMLAGAGADPLAPPADPPADAACPARADDLPTPADPRLSGDAVIVVLKAARRIGLYRSGALIEGACWEVALAAGYPAGHKQREGDLKTPEGWYRTSDKPNSSFYGAIAVHYPGVEDALAGEREGAITARQRAAIVDAHARGLKPPQATALGGEILVHGGGAGPDWTLGCVAMDNPELDRLRAMLPAGMATNLLVLP